MELVCELFEFPMTDKLKWLHVTPRQNGFAK